MQVTLGVYLDLAFRLRNSGDPREPDDVVVLALKAGLGIGDPGWRWSSARALRKGRRSAIF